MKKTLLILLAALSTQVAPCSGLDYPSLDSSNANKVTLVDGGISYATEIKTLEWMKSKDFETFYHYNSDINTEVFIFLADDMINSFAGIKVKGKESQISSCTLMKENNVFIYDFNDSEGDTAARIISYIRPDLKVATYSYQAF